MMYPYLLKAYEVIENVKARDKAFTLECYRERAGRGLRRC